MQPTALDIAKIATNPPERMRPALRKRAEKDEVPLREAA